MYDLEDLIQLRHSLHQYPELSGKEEHTAKRICDFLARYEPDELLTGLGGYGIAAFFQGKKPGPRTLFRAELDALPILETTNIPHKSSQAGVSHKCGHDGHMAILTGLASLIHHHSLDQGTVILLYQPAEETGMGAQAVLEDKRSHRLDADYVFALHNIPKYPKGQVIIKPQAFAAASVGVYIRLMGETSHAAFPEEGRSPAAATGEILKELTQLQHASEKEEEFELVTVVGVRLGDAAFGTSPGNAEIMATLRTFNDERLDALQKRITSLVNSHATTHHLDTNLRWVERFPSTINNPQTSAMVEHAARDMELPVIHMTSPLRWSEDFGWFTQRTPGTLFGLGSGEGQAPLHGFEYDFPDDLIETGSRLFYRILQRVSANPPSC